MSINSGAKRLQRRKREVSMYHKLKWVGAFTRICNWPGGCDKKSYQWKRCNEHRFTASVDAEGRSGGSGEMKPYYEEKGIAIYHGDCREILPTLEPVDLVLTDPPYGTGCIKGGGKKQGQFSGKAIREKWDVWSTEWLKAARAQYFAIFCPDLAIYSLAQFFPTYRLRYYIKSNPRPSVGGLDSPSVEPIFISPRVRFGSRAHCIAYNGDAVHPCQKPLDVICWMLKGMAADGEAVLDPFMGSGTTLRAAKDFGLRGIGIEIEEKYCEIAAKRLQQEVFDFTAA